VNSMVHTCVSTQFGLFMLVCFDYSTTKCTSSTKKIFADALEFVPVWFEGI